MLLFIGWSGRTSEKIAKSLKRWIENVNPNVASFVSFEDISLGTNWRETLYQALEDTNYGILCVTPDNRNAPWLVFETAQMELAMRQHNPQGKPYIVPLLFCVESIDLPSLFSQYQSAKFNRDTMWRLVKETNGVCRKLYGVELSKVGLVDDDIDMTYLTQKKLESLERRFDALYMNLESEVMEILKLAGYLSR